MEEVRVDRIEFANLSRARDALQAAFTNTATRANAKAFTDAAWAILRTKDVDGGWKALQGCDNPLVVKAAAHGLLDDVWADGAAALVRDYLATIAPFSIIDALKRYARVLPAGSMRAMVASDAAGDVVSEGDPKPVM